MKQRAEFPAWVLTAIALIAVAVLTGTGHAVPAALWAFSASTGAGALGLTVPGAQTAKQAAPVTKETAAPSSASATLAVHPSAAPVVTTSPPA